MKRNQLKDMLIKEISLVDNPANQHARAVLTKRHDSTETADSFLAKVKAFLYKDDSLGVSPSTDDRDAATFSESLSEADRWKYLSALQTSISSILDDDALDAAGKQAMIDETVAEFKETLAAEGVIKAAGTEDDEPKGSDIEIDPDTAAIAAAEITDPEKSLDNTGLGPDDKNKDKAGYNTKKEKSMTETMNKADISKAVEEAVSKATADLIKKNDDLTAELQRMKDEKEEADRMDKAKEMVKGVHGFTAEQVAGIIKGMTPEAVETFAKSLKANAETVAKSKAFAELGTSQVIKAGSAVDQLNKAASEIRKSEPALSNEQAFRKATKQNRELYKQYLAETSAN